MSFTVRILPRAEEDATALFIWISERSTDGAHAWLKAFELVVSQLEENPYAFGLAPESGLRDFELRQFLFRTRRGRTYRGVFTIQLNSIYVLRVRGPGQAPLTEFDIQDSGN